MSITEDSKFFRKEGKSIIASFPNFQHASKLYSGYSMGTKEAIRALYNLVPELYTDTLGATLDLAVQVDSHGRSINTLITKRDTDLKTINENFRLHRELIDGFTEIFANQQAEIDGLWKVVNRQKAQIEVLAKLDTPETS